MTIKDEFPLGPGKCNCLTKTPDPQYHKHDCPVWMYDYIIKLERDLENYKRHIGNISGEQ